MRAGFGPGPLFYPGVPEGIAESFFTAVGYEGRPSQTQIERTDALAKELADVVHEFDNWSAKELGGINADLTSKKLDQIHIVSRSEWDKNNAAAK